MQAWTSLCLFIWIRTLLAVFVGWGVKFWLRWTYQACTGLQRVCVEGGVRSMFCEYDDDILLGEWSLVVVWKRSSSGRVMLCRLSSWTWWWWVSLQQSSLICWRCNSDIWVHRVSYFRPASFFTWPTANASSKSSDFLRLMSFIHMFRPFFLWPRRGQVFWEGGLSAVNWICLSVILPGHRGATIYMAAESGGAYVVV